MRVDANASEFKLRKRQTGLSCAKFDAKRRRQPHRVGTLDGLLLNGNLRSRIKREGPLAVSGSRRKS